MSVVWHIINHLTNHWVREAFHQYKMEAKNGPKLDLEKAPKNLDDILDAFNGPRDGAHICRLSGNGYRHHKATRREMFFDLPTLRWEWRGR